MNSEKNLKNRRKRDKIGYNLVYDFVKVTGAIPTLLYVRPKAYYPEGKPSKRGAMLLSSNHVTFLDPILIHTVFPLRRINSLATKELYKNKFMTNFLTFCHCIMVDKQNFSMSALHDILDRLNQGKLVVIFPEGQVNTEEQNSVMTFKSGVILMAYKSGAPVIPIYIVKREKWYHRQEIVIGGAVDIRAMVGAVPSMQEINAAGEYLRQKEFELKSFYENLKK